MSVRGLPEHPGYSQHVPVMYSKPLSLRPVSLRRCLRDDRRQDPLSGVPLGPASAALRYLLPVYDLELNTPASSGGLQEIMDNQSFLQEIPMACHVTGSSIERLSVPPYTERQASGEGDVEVPHYRVADVDMMVELKQIRVAARRGAGLFYMDTTRASHRGYTRVVLDGGGVTMEQLQGMPAALFFKTAEEEEGEQGEEERKVEEEERRENEEKKTEENQEEKTEENGQEKTIENKEEKTEESRGENEKEGRSKEVETKGATARTPTLYLSIDAVNTHLAAQFQAATPDVQVVRQGPAINIQQLKENQQESPGGAHSYIEDCDLVPALPLTERPPELAAWLERVQGRRWPGETLRTEIERSGRCFLVGAGHASSARRDLEWRLSFSEPERRLALSLTPQQRKVYVLIKMMQKCYLQQPKVLVTYHIKTLMFWQLEECGDTDWLEEELFSHLLAMLDRITACLERHYIPSYFNPDNNLISHAPAEDVAAVLSTVREIRCQPLQHLYGIDERFRFDFSAPRPLSELHAPLREAILAGAGSGEGDGDGDRDGSGDGGGEAGAVAEALVLSLISQAQADVERGLPVLKHCAGLLRDAWGALAAAGPEGASHPVHEDWAVFAAAAVLTSMEAEQSAHLTLAIRMAVWEEKRPTTRRQLTGDEAQATAALIAPMLGTGSDSENPLSQMAQQACASGSMEEPPAVEQLLSVRHAQLELLRDLKNRSEEQASGSPPMSAAITSTRLQLVLVELTYRMQVSSGVPELEARLQVLSQTMPMTQGLLLGGGGQSDLHGMLSRMLTGLGVPADIADTVQKEAAPDLDHMYQQLAPATANPAFQNDPRITALIPLDMIHVFHMCTLGPGLSDEVVDLRYTAFFNMMGFFLKHQRYLFAFRTVGRMICLRLAALEAEMTRSIYQLSRAGLYLQQLPEPVRVLLRLTSSRAAIGVIYYFIDFMHLTYDWTLMTELLAVSPSEHLTKLEKTIADAESFAAPDVRLTHQVMLLVALRILGREMADCLQRVGALGGEEVAEAAAAALAGWCPPSEPEKGTETAHEKAQEMAQETKTEIAQETARETVQETTQETAQETAQQTAQTDAPQEITGETDAPQATTGKPVSAMSPGVATIREVAASETPETDALPADVQTTGTGTADSLATEASRTEVSASEAPATRPPASKVRTAEAPTTEAPTIEAQTTEAPTTEAQTTEAQTREAPTTGAQATEAPAIQPVANENLGIQKRAAEIIASLSDRRPSVASEHEISPIKKRWPRRCHIL